MSLHYFTEAERREHLAILANALERAAESSRTSPITNIYANDLETAASCAKEMLSEGFSQTDLTDFANALPDPFGMRHNPRWEPPVEQTSDGRWQEASWFQEVGAKLEAVNSAAANLRTIGYY